MKVRFTGMVILMIAMTVACSKQENKQHANAGRSETSNVDAPLAPDFTLNDLDGNKVTLSALRGKVVIIDFWATWCGPCVKSFPAMQAAADKFHNDDDVLFLFINTGERGADIQERVSRFINAYNYNVQVLLDLNSRVASAYGVRGIPTKVLVDTNGRIRDTKVGGSANTNLVINEMTEWVELCKKE